jgi:hypothetical protein
MATESSIPISDCLLPSELCDSGNENILKIALRLSRNSQNQADIALRIFSYVRDNIKFNATLDIFLKASEAVKRKTIDYCNKINIHIALLRAIGIPARYHFIRAEKEILRHLVPKFLYAQLPRHIGHFWCECCLEGKWIACEALFDKPFYQGMLKAGWIDHDRIPGIDWDGEHDLVLLRKWIVQDGKIYSRYDDLAGLAQKEGMPPKIFCKLMEWLPAYFSSRQTDAIREG